jgi:hypothetical protein
VKYEANSRDRHVVIAFAAIAFMIALPISLMGAGLALVADKWTWGTTISTAVGVIVILSSVGLMVRVHRDDWRRSLFASGWGLSLACVGILLLGGFVGLCVWGIVLGELTGGKVYASVGANCLAIAYLAEKAWLSWNGSLEKNGAHLPAEETLET